MALITSWRYTREIDVEIPTEKGRITDTQHPVWKAVNQFLAQDHRYLDHLEVQTKTRMTGQARAQFGNGWSDYFYHHHLNTETHTKARLSAMD